MSLLAPIATAALHGEMFLFYRPKKETCGTHLLHLLKKRHPFAQPYHQPALLPEKGEGRITISQLFRIYPTTL